MDRPGFPVTRPERLHRKSTLSRFPEIERKNELPPPSPSGHVIPILCMIQHIFARYVISIIIVHLELGAADPNSKGPSVHKGDNNNALALLSLNSLAITKIPF